MDSNPIRAKQNLHMRRKKAHKNSWNRSNQKSPKVVYTDNSMEFGQACEVLSWNHRTSTPRRSETKWHRWKSRSTSKGRYVSSNATVRTGWKVVVRFYGMLLLSTKCPRPPGRREKRRTKDDLENRSKGQSYLLEQWLNIIPLHRKISREFIKLSRKNFQESFLAMSQSRWEFGKDIFRLRIWKMWKSWTHRIFIIEESTRKKYGTAKLSGRDHEFRETTKAGTDCEEWKSQWEKFKANRKSLNRQNQQVTLKPVPTSGRCKVTSSIAISLNQGVQGLCAEGRNISYSTEIHGCYQVYSYWSGTYCKKRRLTIIGVSSHASICQTLREDSQNWLYLKRNLPKGYMGSEERLTRIQNDYQTRLCMCRNLDEIL